MMIDHDVYILYLTVLSCCVGDVTVLTYLGKFIIFLIHGSLSVQSCFSFDKIQIIYLTLKR